MDTIIYYCRQELELTGVWDEREDKGWRQDITRKLNGWRQDITRKLNGWRNQEVPAFVKNEGNLHGLYVYRPMLKWIQEGKRKGFQKSTRTTGGKIDNKAY